MTKVSEALAKDIEIAALRATNFELQVQAQHATLIQARDALVQKARAEVGAPDGHVYDTDTREFRDPAGKPPLSVAKTRQVRRAEARKKAT